MKRRFEWIVFKKEVIDILRDKKTIFSSIVLPIILMPVLMLLIGGGTQKMTKEMTENITVALTQDCATPEAQSFLINNIAMQDKDIIVMDPVADPREAIRNGDIKLVVVLDGEFKSRIEQGKPFSIRILYDDSRTRSGGAVKVLEGAIEQYNRETIKARLESLGLDTEILTAAAAEKENISEASSGNFMLAMIFPMLIAMLIAVGGIPAAVDLMAGEKERMTLEPLMATRASRLSLLLGKYFTINLFALFSLISTLSGFVVSFLISPESITMGAGNIGGIHLPPAAVLLSLLITILLGMTFSGIQLAISTYARSFKEAQSYLSLLIFVVMIPAYATMMMPANDIQLYMYLVPVLNTISAFKMILEGMINYTGLILALASSVVYVLMTLYMAVAFFKKESVLFRAG